MIRTTRTVPRFRFAPQLNSIQRRPGSSLTRRLNKLEYLIPFLRLKETRTAGSSKPPYFRVFPTVNPQPASARKSPGTVPRGRQSTIVADPYWEERGRLLAASHSSSIQSGRQTVCFRRLAEGQAAVPLLPVCADSSRSLSAAKSAALDPQWSLRVCRSTHSAPRRYVPGLRPAARPFVQ